MVSSRGSYNVAVTKYRLKLLNNDPLILIGYSWKQSSYNSPSTKLSPTMYIVDTIYLLLQLKRVNAS